MFVQFEMMWSLSSSFIVFALGIFIWLIELYQCMGGNRKLFSISLVMAFLIVLPNLPFMFMCIALASPKVCCLPLVLKTV